LIPLRESVAEGESNLEYTIRFRIGDGQLSIAFNSSFNHRRQYFSHEGRTNTRDPARREVYETWESSMARFEINSPDVAAMGAQTITADVFFQMGIDHSIGRGVPADMVAAHMWFNLAAAQGNREAARYRQEISQEDRKSTRLNSSHRLTSRMPSSA
jgi:hypothetical protein